jgi:hypothetical protein
MTGIKKYILLLVFLAGLLPSFGSTMAKNAFLSDIILTNSKEYLLLYFTVEGCFTPEMEKAIDNGIETTFTFYVNLHETIAYHKDPKLADIEINHSLRYDNIKKIYEIKLPEQDNKIVTVKSLDEAKKLMAEVVALPITPLTNLKKGHRYELRMMAELKKVRLPYYLHYVLFFLSLWNFETDWYSVDFRY